MDFARKNALTFYGYTEENLFEAAGWIRKEGGIMFGLFGKKGGSGLTGPKDIPDQVGQQLVVNYKEDPEWVWRLKSVMKPGEMARKDTFHIRVFAEHMAVAAKVHVKDFTTLDAYPNLILYEGVFDKKAKTAKIQKRHQKT
jgi:hypothetical protein